MKQAIAAVLACACLSALPLAALAISPDASLRPLARGQSAEPTLQRPKLRPALSEAETQAIVEASAPMRPKLRARSEQEKAMSAPAGAQIHLASAASVGMPQSLHPNLRPKGLEQKAMARKRKRLAGAICGDPDLQGDVVGYVPGKIGGCGVKDAIKLRSVSGVALSQSSIMDCGTARALKSWVNKGLKPAIGKRGGGVAKIKVAAHYACRTRNNKRGAKISEHGKGRAIDISGFTLRDGSTITVLKGWRSRADSKALKRMHKAACGPFGTVLGPNADRYHQDHFHFDTARYRSGSYCR